MLADLPPGVPVLATTATANARVTADVAEQLGTGASTDALVLRGPLDRESLSLGVLRLPDAAHRMAWLAEHLSDLPGWSSRPALAVAAAEEVAAFLRQSGHTVTSYTGKTENADRQQAEEDLLANRVKALVATSALGGARQARPRIRGAPGLPLLPHRVLPAGGARGPRGEACRGASPAGQGGPGDLGVLRVDRLPLPEEQVRRTLDVLARAALSLPALEPLVELRRSRLETMLKVLDVDGAVRRVQGGWISTGVPWTYDTERYAWVAERAAEQQAMRDYVSTTGCRMEFLRRQLDDELAKPCGRCDTCAGARFEASVLPAALDAANGELGRAGVEHDPRKMWPTGLPAVGVDLKGRIPAGEQAAPGRASAYRTSAGATGCGRCSHPGTGRDRAGRCGEGRGRRPDRLGEGAGRLGLRAARRAAAPGRRRHHGLAQASAVDPVAGRTDRGGRPTAAAGVPWSTSARPSHRSPGATAPSGSRHSTGRWPCRPRWQPPSRSRRSRAARGRRHRDGLDARGRRAHAATIRGAGGCPLVLAVQA